MMTETTHQSIGDLFTVGAGYLEVSALNNNNASHDTTLSAIAVYDALTQQTFLTLTIRTSTIIWGTGTVWSNRVRASSNAVLWGSAVVWGRSTNESFAVLWGTDPGPADPEAFPRASAFQQPQNRTWLYALDWLVMGRSHDLQKPFKVTNGQAARQVPQDPGRHPVA